MRRNARTGLILAVVAACMLGLAFASVPLFRLFCERTGAYGTTGQATALPTTTSERTVTVHFNAETQPGLPWTFQAVSGPVTAKLGAPAHGMFRATNTGTRPVIGVARYNVTPGTVGKYFEKVECFCFEPHELKPGESADFPVLFFVDPSLDDDATLRDIKEITLSYTFYEQP